MLRRRSKFISDETTVENNISCLQLITQLYSNITNRQYEVDKDNKLCQQNEY